jgi:catecholate siderophore receptor
VQNLTDERYYDQVYASHYAHVAAGRTALLSTNFHF